MFLYLIPILYKAVGNFQLTKQCYEAILGLKVDICEHTAPVLKNVDAIEMRDGKLMLGVNFVCGNSFCGDKPSVNIAIGPLTTAQFQEYLPGGRGMEVIAFLNDYYLPVDIDVQMSIVADATGKAFVLSENEEVPRLGYTTSI
jgi:predicted component of type VI protein secretion system